MLVYTDFAVPSLVLLLFFSKENNSRNQNQNMTSFLVFLLFTFILCGQCNLLLAKNKSCEHLLGELGDGQSHFIYCATTKSVPVNLCIGCDIEFHNLSNDYNNLMADPNCSSIYLDSDRINIVATTQGILTNLWQKANCDGG